MKIYKSFIALLLSSLIVLFGCNCQSQISSENHSNEASGESVPVADASESESLLNDVTIMIYMKHWV